MNAHVSVPDGSKNLSPSWQQKPHRSRGGRPPGRDPKSERSRKPWLAMGISERTYRRRKAAALYSAHVTAWFATLGPIARLEYRSMVRRCVRAMGRRQSDVAVLDLYMRALGAN